MQLQVQVEAVRVPRGTEVAASEVLETDRYAGASLDDYYYLLTVTAATAMGCRALSHEETWPAFAVIPDALQQRIIPWIFTFCSWRAPLPTQHKINRAAHYAGSEYSNNHRCFRTVRCAHP
jgi:hypothetical protein